MSRAVNHLIYIRNAISEIRQWTLQGETEFKKNSVLIKATLYNRKDSGVVVIFGRGKAGASFWLGVKYGSLAEAPGLPLLLRHSENYLSGKIATMAF